MPGESPANPLFHFPPIFEDFQSGQPAGSPHDAAARMGPGGAWIKVLVRRGMGLIPKVTSCQLTGGFQIGLDVARQLRVRKG
jgi:hypothetical protein